MTTQTKKKSKTPERTAKLTPADHKLAKRVAKALGSDVKAVLGLGVRYVERDAKAATDRVLADLRGSGVDLSLLAS